MKSISALLGAMLMSVSMAAFAGDWTQLGAKEIKGGEHVTYGYLGKKLTVGQPYQFRCRVMSDEPGVKLGYATGGEVVVDGDVTLNNGKSGILQDSDKNRFKISSMTLHNTDDSVSIYNESDPDTTIKVACAAHEKSMNK